MIETDTYKEWIGRSKADTDLITRTPLNALAATLNCESPESVVPPLWHWFNFLSPVRMRDIGTDGHRLIGNTMVPIEFFAHYTHRKLKLGLLPHRMVAVVRLNFC